MHKILIFILYKDNIIFYITINNFKQYQMVVDIFILWDKILVKLLRVKLGVLVINDTFRGN